MGTEKRARQKANRAQKVAQQQVQDKRESRRRQVIGFVVAVAVVAAIAGLIYVSSGDSDSSTTAGTTTTQPTAPSTTLAKLVDQKFTYGTTPCPPADGSAKRTLNFDAPPENCLQAGKTYQATFDTTAGKVVVDLDTKSTPGTANNFVFLSRYHYYDDNNIFRISPGIDILQSGSPHTQTASDPGPGYKLLDEGKISDDGSRGDYTYEAGDLVMARSAGPDGGSAQIFLATGPKVSNLDATGNYVVFGKVTEGLDVLKKIQSSIKVTNQPFQGDGEPDPMVTIKTVTITEK